MGRTPFLVLQTPGFLRSPAHMNGCIGLALASRLVHRFLNGRKQIFEDGAASEIDLGGNLHAWAQLVFCAVPLKVRRFQRHNGAKSALHWVVAAQIIFVGFCRSEWRETL